MLSTHDLRKPPRSCAKLAISARNADEIFSKSVFSAEDDATVSRPTLVIRA
jgi:hypothetical protein